MYIYIYIYISLLCLAEGNRLQPIWPIETRPAGFGERSEIGRSELSDEVPAELPSPRDVEGTRAGTRGLFSWVLEPFKKIIVRLIGIVLWSLLW